MKGQQEAFGRTGSGLLAIDQWRRRLHLANAGKPRGIAQDTGVNDLTDHGFGAEFVRLVDGGPSPDARQVALVPGAEIPILALDLPKGLRGQAREQVARRQLRDRTSLTGDVIEMRPFAPSAQADSWHRVLLADAGRLGEWRRNAGPLCRALLPDYLALPTCPALWTVGQVDGQILVRLGPDDGFSAMPPVALALLSKQIQQSEAKPSAILCLSDDMPEVEALAVANDIAIVRDAQALKPLGLPMPKVLGHGELAFDLRRNPQLARARLRAALAPWRWPLLVGLGAAAVWAAALTIETKRIETEIDALRQQTESLARTHFIPTGPLLDLRVQVAQALAQHRKAAAGGGAPDMSALDLFARAAAVIARTNAQTDSAVSGSPDALTLVMRVTDFAAADALAEALRDAGLQVDVVETRVTDAAAEVRSELRITGDARVAK